MSAEKLVKKEKEESSDIACDMSTKCVDKLIFVDAKDKIEDDEVRRRIFTIEDYLKLKDCNG